MKKNGASSAAAALSRRNNNTTPRRLTVYDTAAVLFGAALLVCFAVTARYAVAMPDEASYWLLGHRLSFGDRMISDEWHLTQFGYMVLLPAYYLYTGIVGSTEGLILFARYLFIAVDLLFYCGMVRRLRQYRLAGVVSSFLFCALVPQLFFAFSYCTMSVFAVMLLCLILFFGKQSKTVPQLFLSGVVLAIAVLEDPLLLLGYLLWVFFVLLYAVFRRTKRTLFSQSAFFLEGRSFFWITLGAAAVFVVFLAFLLLNGAFEEFDTVLPYLFSGAEYNASNLLDPDRLSQSVRFYGKIPFFGLAACAVLSPFVRILKKGRRHVAAIVLSLSCILFAACLIHGGVQMLKNKSYWNAAIFCQSHNLPLLLFAPIPFLVGPRPDRRHVCVLIIGLIYSLLMDIPSKSFLAMGGFIVRVPLILQLSAMAEEALRRRHEPQPTPQSKKVGLAAVKGCAAILFAVCFLWEGGYIVGETVYKIPEKLFLFSEDPLDTALEKGPMRGLKTTAGIAGIYRDTLADLDVIREATDGGAAVLDVLPYAWLYLDRPYASFSPIYMGETERLAAYWALPYTRDPQYLYLPYYNPYLLFRYDRGYLNLRLQELREIVDCEVTQGAAGYIIRVRSAATP